MIKKKAALNFAQNKQYVIGINDARVLRTLWIEKSISRIELSRFLGLDKSTISKIINNLLESGIVELLSEGEASPNGGRKPTYMSIKQNYGAVLGIEMQTDFYIAVVVDFSGKILFQSKGALSLEGISVPKAAYKIYQAFYNDLEKLQIPIIGGAIGVSGLVNPFDGIIYCSNPLSIFEAQNMYGELDELFDFPILIDNDANCGAWGELAFKKEQIHKDDFIFVLGETRQNRVIDAQYTGIAIGTSLVLDQKVRYGQQYSSGEFQSIFRSGEHMNQFAITDSEAGIYEQDGQLFSKVAHELSQNIALLVNMLNLQQVVLGGRMEYHPEILTIMQEEIFDNWSYDNPLDIRVRFSTLKDLTIAYGAAGMFFESFFGLPDISYAKKPVNTHKLRTRAALATPFHFENV